ncbi:hypothetical protein GGR57DRAFT_505397 [Xylariaceae sp. FL1272]|nr:hypothetical protein GGR57DRAFT_505397 [Xylariaceae sp. FL1272]
MTTTNISTYGRRLMPCVLDELARQETPKLYGSTPKANHDLSQGFRDISVADMARCVDYMAAWLKDRFGTVDNNETLTYMGIQDFRGVVVFHASVKCGYKLLLPSPRNPASTNVSLMQQTGSTKLLYATEIAPIVKPLMAEDGVRGVEIPSFDDMLESTPEHFPYDKTFDEVCNDPVLVCQSSGSTGVPKPITITHYAFAVLDNEKNYPEIPGRKRLDWSLYNLEGDGRVFTVFPFFHAGGFLGLTFNPIMNNACSVLGPPHAMPDASLINTIRKQYKLQVMFLTPSIVEQLLHEPNAMDLFEGLKFLVTSGAPLSRHVGDRLSKVVPMLLSPYGSTEILTMPQLVTDPEDWEWYEFNSYCKHEMRLFDGDEGTYELIILSNHDIKDRTVVYHTLPGIKEFHTKDLFLKHPTKSGLWKYYGRCDDILVLANGHKLNAIPFEARIQSHASLMGALLTGNAKTQTALIVESKTALDASGQEQLIEELWPLVEEANTLIASQGRVQKGMILCTQPEKGFVRAGKGTIIRKLSQALYQPELDILYGSLLAGDKTVMVDLKSKVKTVFELSDVMTFVRQVLSVSFHAADTIGENEDFFSYGLDSVTTLEIVGNLRRNLSKHHPHATNWVSARTIYLHSNIAALSQLLCDFLNTGSEPVDDVDHEQIGVVNELMTKFSSNLPARGKEIERSASQGPLTVVLIGSTGYLGQHIVSDMLRDPAITSIYCLNRSINAQERQEAALGEISTDIQPLLGKLHYMNIKIGSPKLGLSAADYDILVNTADVIVYNAWRLDFGLSVRSFEPFLKGIRDIIDLSASSRRSARIVFISSLSSVAKMTHKPEEVVEDPHAALGTGYAQSKLVAERVLSKASDVSGLSVHIVRVGQVGGLMAEGKGKWQDQAWISAVLRTSQALCCMPEMLTPIDWVPVDVAASMVGRIISIPQNAAGKSAIQVLHINSHQPLPWSDLIDIMRERHNITETVPLVKWIEKLRTIQDPSPDDIARMPALRLLDHYDALQGATLDAGVATEKTRASTQIETPVLDRATLVRWLGDWGI